ncbi:tyrosine-protein phosphatase siw14 [Coemansia sp. RSA 2706]|nr:tyrosine-protein phosphatase siw14 [Coemansia sp. RSA 2711]KAJ1845630.1 tyrosine-protein phosphatase siw14 [Coemansia sp. RSA 2708]KAJ2288284.1 tyrosine-protein phosphatase siw14 [Coemansia sp. RSA 2706]KAJ2310197.1 tyrosine-protein phosphatase siw14 [Coemansia sp. RSA 2705]KAJ2311923.1 tyrosine-protein phosphatase siw14 [Coemansia sp. RSA 2704]KAJ2314924.1 tyrosine-protein phosphatase siw14 [Coemansia sp. RSA 2702]KAJ2365453.1 tyrosine-protein phosphatase siw14 [Coemansia sp. RSA 2610]KA
MTPLTRTDEQQLRQAQQQSQLMVPPLNFALIAPGIYRSGFPNPKSHPFLLQLGLRTIIYVFDGDCQPYHLQFIQDNSINYKHFRVAANKEPFAEMDHAVVAQILAEVLDTRNHPLLLHCNRGIRRVGCLVGCIRKLQGWAMTAIFDEYQRFSGTKIRIADQEFIEVFRHPVSRDPQFQPAWLED